MNCEKTVSFSVKRDLDPSYHPLKTDAMDWKDVVYFQVLFYL